MKKLPFTVHVHLQNANITRKEYAVEVESCMLSTACIVYAHITILFQKKRRMKTVVTYLKTLHINTDRCFVPYIILVNFGS